MTEQHPVSDAERERAFNALQSLDGPVTNTERVQALIDLGWRPGGAPAAPDRDRLAKLFMEYGDDEHELWSDALVKDLVTLALSAFESRDAIKAEALEEAAVKAVELEEAEILRRKNTYRYHYIPDDFVVARWLEDRAAELRGESRG